MSSKRASRGCQRFDIAGEEGIRHVVDEDDEKQYKGYDHGETSASEESNRGPEESGTSGIGTGISRETHQSSFVQVTWDQNDRLNIVLTA